MTTPEHTAGRRAGVELTFTGRLNAGGSGRLDAHALLGELDPEDEFDDYNPVCDCPRVPSDWCQACSDCATCGECTHRPRRVLPGPAPQPGACHPVTASGRPR